MQAIFSTCLAEPASRFTTNYGLLLLSKQKLTETKVRPLTSANVTQAQGYMQATVSYSIRTLCNKEIMILDTHVG